MKIYSLLIAASILFSLSAISQDVTSAKDKEAAYNETINARAEKIVAPLAIADTAKASRVKNCIASQYKNLNHIYTARDLQNKTVKEQNGNDKGTANTQLNKITVETTAKTDSLHKIFIAQLSGELSPKQVEQVKDGMTYNVLNVTYNGYNQMILTLTEPQKKQIMVWLIEAREHAMDAESSEKKHAWFGKYKGRINNYLSAQGYDLRKEGEEWEKRRKEEAEKKKSA